MKWRESNQDQIFFFFFIKSSWNKYLIPLFQVKELASRLSKYTIKENINKESSNESLREQNLSSFSWSSSRFLLLPKEGFHMKLTKRWGFWHHQDFLTIKLTSLASKFSFFVHKAPTPSLFVIKERASTSSRQGRVLLC